MELKHLTKITYRIEPKPEGGFIARPADPGVPPLEAPTREELLQKIQAKIAAELGSGLAGLELPFTNKLLNNNSFKFSEGLAGANAKTFGNLNEQKDVVVNVSSEKFITQTLLPTGLNRADGTEDMRIGNQPPGISALNASTPITPGISKSWTILRLLLAALVLAAFVYFLRHR